MSFRPEPKIPLVFAAVLGALTWWAVVIAVRHFV